VALGNLSTPPKLHETQLSVFCSQLQHTPKSVLPASFECFCNPPPCRRTELGDCLKVPHNQEVTMRSIATIVLPIIFAAGISGMMFTAALV
jgi:hypothetical protein